MTHKEGELQKGGSVGGGCRLDAHTQAMSKGPQTQGWARTAGSLGGRKSGDGTPAVLLGGGIPSLQDPLAPIHPRPLRLLRSEGMPLAS